MSVAKSANRTLLISRFPSDSSASMPVNLKNTRFFIYYDYNLEYRLQARFYKKGYLSEQKYPTNGRCKRWRLSSNYDKNNAFQLYALCIMSNHVHYLIEPTAKEDLPKIMHFRQLVQGDVFQPDARSHGAFLGKEILLRWVSITRIKSDR